MAGERGHLTTAVYNARRRWADIRKPVDILVREALRLLSLENSVTEFDEALERQLAGMHPFAASYVFGRARLR